MQSSFCSDYAVFTDANDKYAETAKDLEKRIRRALKSQVDSGGRKIRNIDELLFRTAGR